MDRAEPRPSWKNSTAVIIAGGPSLTPDDVRHVWRVWAEQGGVRIIAVNESWRICGVTPHIIYGADSKWWKERGPKIGGYMPWEHWTQDHGWQTGEAEALGIKQIRSHIGANISLDSSFIYQGGNSSFQAMNLAVLFGVRRIVFLGLDLSADGKQTHWHEYPEEFKRRDPGYGMFRSAFETAAPILQDLGIEVVNASRRTVLECFPRMTIQEALTNAGS